MADSREDAMARHCTMKLPSQFSDRGRCGGGERFGCLKQRGLIISEGLTNPQQGEKGEQCAQKGTEVKTRQQKDFCK